MALTPRTGVPKGLCPKCLTRPRMDRSRVCEVCYAEGEDYTNRDPLDMDRDPFFDPVFFNEEGEVR